MMMRLAIVLGLGLALAKNPEDDLKALDMADEQVTDALPATVKPVPKAPVAVKKAAPKVHKKVAAPKKVVPDPKATAKTSALWHHENELTAEDEADKVLDEGDAEAKEKIEEIHEKEESKVAPARVHRVSEEEAAAAKNDKTDVLETVETVVQDIKDVKQAKLEEAKRKAEVEKEEKQEAEEKKKGIVKKNATKASKPAPPQKKINLDKLMNLANAAKASALGKPAKTQLMQEVEEGAPPVKGIVANAFKGASTKAEVKNNTRALHSKMAQHIASMHTALHEQVKTQEEEAAYKVNKAAVVAQEAAAAAKAQADAEAQKKKEQSAQYQAALKASAEKAKVEAEERAVAKAKVADYRAAQRKLREAKPEQPKVLVKPQVAVQQNTPDFKKSSAFSSGVAFVTLAMIAAGF